MRPIFSFKLIQISFLTPGIPYAIKQAGFGAGIGLILLVGLITEKSLRLLVETAKHVQTPTYETLAEASFGMAGFRFILANMFIISFGAMVSYLMIVKDSFSFFFHISSEDVTAQNLLLLGISLCIQLPLACLRDMADLDKSSRVAVFIDVLLVGIVAYCAPWNRTLADQGGVINLLHHDTVHYDSIFVGLGVLSFAFECQESAFLVAGSLKDPTRKRWSTVSRSALIICVCLALICGTAGYVGYLDLTDGNILNNLDRHSWAGTVAHGMLGATMFATYPLASFVARHVCVVLLFEGQRAHEGDDTSVLDRADRRIALTLALYIMAVSLASYCRDFGSVLALAGVIGGSCIAYLAPGMLFLGVHGGRFLELVQESWFFSINHGTSSSEDGRNPVTVAVETTPLVRSRQEGDAVLRRQRLRREKQLAETRSMLGMIKTLMYCLCGFPIWCAIADTGRKTLTQHVQKLVRQSRHPIRIGNVQFSLARVLADGTIDADPRNSTVVANPGSGHEYSEPLKGSANPKSMSLEELNKHSTDDEQSSLEPDPQERPPSWIDFGVAIFYIVFGAVALIAGLYSLFDNENKSESSMTQADADSVGALTMIDKLSNR